jgi:hypothetical protein
LAKLVIKSFDISLIIKDMQYRCANW